MSSVTVVMSSGDRHQITLPPAQVSELYEMLNDTWLGKRRSSAHSFNRSDGGCVLINPAFIEAVVVR